MKIPLSDRTFKISHSKLSRCLRQVSKPFSLQQPSLVKKIDATAKGSSSTIREQRATTKLSPAEKRARSSLNFSTMSAMISVKFQTSFIRGNFIINSRQMKLSINQSIGMIINPTKNRQDHSSRFSHSKNFKSLNGAWVILSTLTTLRRQFHVCS